jgi:hypothetical protein
MLITTYAIPRGDLPQGLVGEGLHEVTVSFDSQKVVSSTLFTFDMCHQADIFTSCVEYFLPAEFE